LGLRFQDLVQGLFSEGCVTPDKCRELGIIPAGQRGLRRVVNG
jgi:hypothetical protein